MCDGNDVTHRVVIVWIVKQNIWGKINFRRFDKKSVSWLKCWGVETANIVKAIKKSINMQNTAHLYLSLLNDFGNKKLQK